MMVWGFLLYAVFGLGSMATMSIAAAVLLGVMVFCGGPRAYLQAVKEEFQRPLIRRYLDLSVVLIFAIFASLVAAKLFPLSYGGHQPRIEFAPALAKTWYLLWPPLLVAGLRRLAEAERERVLRAWLWTFVALSVFGVVQYFIGWPKYQAIPGVEGRFHSVLFFGHHLSTASILIFPFFAALDALRARKLLPRAALWTGVAFGLVTLFFTYSRTAWVAVPFGICVWSLLRLSRKQILLVVGLVAVVVGIGSQFQVVQKRVKMDLGYGDRKALWQANYAFLQERPLTGTGFRHNIEVAGYYLQQKLGTQEVFTGHAHNNLLDMLGGTGLLGASAWLLWVGWLTVILVRNHGAGRGLFASGLLCAWIVFHLNGITQVNFWEGKVQHQLMWMVAWALLWATPGQGTARGE